MSNAPYATYAPLLNINISILWLNRILLALNATPLISQNSKLYIRSSVSWQKMTLKHVSQTCNQENRALLSIMKLKDVIRKLKSDFAWNEICLLWAGQCQLPGKCIRLSELGTPQVMRVPALVKFDGDTAERMANGHICKVKSRLHTRTVDNS